MQISAKFSSTILPTLIYISLLQVVLHLIDRCLKYLLPILMLTFFFCYQEIQLGCEAHGFILQSLEKVIPKLFEYLFFYSGILGACINVLEPKRTDL
uniref:Uncharacterized protein n=1 Tax=Setaria italica TaxID=4555 RepID=K3Y0B5_SETIT